MDLPKVSKNVKTVIGQKELDVDNGSKKSLHLPINIF
jgi:hypothetical protein